MQIGEVADRAGLSLRTVRHWDDMGVVRPSTRSHGGFRLYSEADLARLLLAKDMKPLGLSLEEMAELADILETDPASIDASGDARLADYLERTERSITKLTTRLREARAMRERIRAHRTGFVRQSRDDGEREATGAVRS